MREAERHMAWARIAPRELFLAMGWEHELRIRNRHRVPSRFQFRQLVEVGVVVRDVKTVNLGTRKDEEIRERNGHAGCPATIGGLHRSIPHVTRDLVVGKQFLIAAKRLAGSLAWSGRTAQSTTTNPYDCRGAKMIADFRGWYGTEAQ